MRWGFGWSQGPFETWQAAGWKSIAEAIAGRHRRRQAPWSTRRCRPGCSSATACMSRAGSYSAAEQARSRRARRCRSTSASSFPSACSARRRRAAAPTVLGKRRRAPVAPAAVDAGIGIVSFKSQDAHDRRTKCSTACSNAVARAERDFDGLVIWQRGAVRRRRQPEAGRSQACEAGSSTCLERVVAKFQRACACAQVRRRCRRSPPSRAWRWAAAASSSCTAPVACVALESYVGLVEAGVGLIPAGGGCKEFALRAAAHRRSARPATIPSTSCRTCSDHRHGQRLQERARSDGHRASLDEGRRSSSSTPTSCSTSPCSRRPRLAEAGYRPPLPRARVAVAGRTGIATLEMMLVNMKEGGMISAHDYRGREGRRHGAVRRRRRARHAGERRMAADRRAARVRRAAEDRRRPRPRIEHMLDTGKPLRN